MKECQFYEQRTKSSPAPVISKEAYLQHNCYMYVCGVMGKALFASSYGL